MNPFGTKHTFELLNQMLDDAIAGTFHESDYNETELSRLESKWMRFLSNSALGREQLEQERTSIQELVSDISHQVKTPIANLRLYGEILSERLSGEDKALAEHLLHETQLLEFLIQSLVKVSRLEAGTIQLAREPQTLLPLLLSVEERSAAKCREKDVTLERSGWNEDVRACFDQKWTSEAVYNILDNAVKYTPPHSTVTVRLEEYPMFACIRIADQGPGITEDEVPRLFDRFYRSPRFHEEEGVGLGLYLAREIIRKEGGYIKVRSNTGRTSSYAPSLSGTSTESRTGAEFSVYLRKSPPSLEDN